MVSNSRCLRQQINNFFYHFLLFISLKRHTRSPAIYHFKVSIFITFVLPLKKNGCCKIPLFCKHLIFTPKILWNLFQIQLLMLLSLGAVKSPFRLRHSFGMPFLQWFNIDFESVGSPITDASSAPPACQWYPLSLIAGPDPFPGGRLLQESPFSSPFTLLSHFPLSPRQIGLRCIIVSWCLFML